MVLRSSRKGSPINSNRHVSLYDYYASNSNQQKAQTPLDAATLNGSKTNLHDITVPITQINSKLQLESGTVTGNTVAPPSF